MDELRKEARELNQKYSNMDFSEADIIIPEVDEIEELIFPFDINIAASKDTYEKVKNNFYENIRKKTITGQGTDPRKELW